MSLLKMMPNQKKKKEEQKRKRKKRGKPPPQKGNHQVYLKMKIHAKYKIRNK